MNWKERNVIVCVCHSQLILIFIDEVVVVAAANIMNLIYAKTEQFKTNICAFIASWNRLVLTLAIKFMPRLNLFDRRLKRRDISHLNKKKFFFLISAHDKLLFFIRLLACFHNKKWWWEIYCVTTRNKNTEKKKSTAATTTSTTTTTTTTLKLLW